MRSVLLTATRLRLHPAGKYLLRTILVYVLFMLPWPGLEEDYARVFRRSGSAVFQAIGLDAELLVREKTSRNSADTYLVLRNPRLLRSDGRSVTGKFSASSRYQFYHPTVFLLALLLPTPIAWSRKARALVWGVVFLALFLALRIVCKILLVCSESPEYAPIQVGTFWSEYLGLHLDEIWRSPSASVLVPMLIWAGLSIRFLDMARLRGFIRRTNTRRPR